MSIHRSIVFVLQTKMFMKKQFSLTCCAWVPPSYLVAGSRDGTLYRWTVPEKIEETTLYPTNSTTQMTNPNSRITNSIISHEGEISFLHWSESMQLLFSGSSDRSVLVWQMNTRAFPKEPLISIRCFESTPLCIETHMKFLFVVEKKGITVLTLSESKNPIDTKQLFKKVASLGSKSAKSNGFNTICFSPNPTVDNSGYLFAGFENGSIQQYDAQLTDNPQFVPAGFPKKVCDFGIYRLIYVQRENLIFVFTYDRHFRIYNPRNNRIVNMFQNPHNEDFVSACYEDSSQQYLLADTVGNLYVYEFQEMARVLYQLKFNNNCMNLVKGPPGKFLFQTREGISMLDINRGTVKQSYKIHNGTIFYINMIDDSISKLIATVGEDKYIRLTDPLNFTSKTPHKMPTNVVVLSAYVDVRERPKNNMIWAVTGHDFGKIFFMNLTDDKKIELPSKHKNSISSIAIVKSDMKVLMLSCDYDGYVSTYSIDSILDNISYAAVSLIKIWKASDQEILASAGQWVQPSPIFATAGNDKMIHVWQEVDGNYNETVLKGHNDSVTVLLFDGFFLFSGSEDLTIRIWDIVNNVQLMMIQRLHKFAIRSISCIEGESKIVSSDAGGEVIVYDYIKKKVLWKLKHSSDCKCFYADKSSNKIFACVKAELIPHTLNPSVMNCTLPSLMSMSSMSSRI